MSDWQWFMLGGMVVLLPSMIVLAVLLWRARGGDRS
jgi:hypothetical protein